MLKKKDFILALIIVAIILCLGFIIYGYMSWLGVSDIPSSNNGNVNNGKDNFEYKFVKEVFKDKNNSNKLVSPYSLNIALDMLKDGSNGTTYETINKVVDTTPKIININKHLSVSNALLVNEGERNSILESYQTGIKSKYDADTLYFNDSNAADIVNNWVKQKTNGMIDSILNPGESMMLGLGNTIYLDVDWMEQFDDTLTKDEEFTKIDGTKTNVKMMNQTYEYSASYYGSNVEKAVVLPYVSYDKNGEKTYEKADNNLEFIGIIPTGDIYDYINNLTPNRIKRIESKAKEASGSYNIVLKLPKFKYDYSEEKMNDILKDIGLADIYGTPDFSKMTTDSSVQVTNVKHKAAIDLAENGTKAAAATVIEMDKASMVQSQVKREKIYFNKPFIYIIKDKNSDDILFFGTLFNPSEAQV